MLESEHPAAVHEVSDVHVLVLKREDIVYEIVVRFSDTWLQGFRLLVNVFKEKERLLDLVPVSSQVDALRDLTDQD